MTAIRYSLTSDLVLDEEFGLDLKERRIDQKHLYQGRNAQNFCEIWNKKVLEDVPTPVELAEAFQRHINKDKRTAIISVGCGDASFEKEALALLVKDNYKVAYFGIDISREMLGLANENLKNAQYPVHLIFGDFMTSEFSNEIPKLIEPYDDTIFLFLGSTLGNLSQTAAIDCLYNLMKPGERLFLEVGVCPSLRPEDSIKIFKRARERLSNMEYMKVYFHQLQEIGIPFDHGKMVIETSTEASVGVIKVTYGFEILKKTVIDYRGHKLHLLPPEVIKLLDIRMYYHETLIQFIIEHDYKHEESVIKPRRGLFIFSK